MISETYRDIEIILLEDENKWRFTANGRQRTALTLPKARESIDNALNNVKAKKDAAWVPIDVYLLESNYGAEYVAAKITSVADTMAWDKTPDVWISENGKRRKTALRSTFAFTDENADRIANLRQLSQQVTELNEEIQRQKKLLAPAVIPKGANQ